MGSGFATAAADMDALHERIADATAQITNFEFPGTGMAGGAADRFNAAQSTITAAAESAGQYATDAATALGLTEDQYISAVARGIVESLPR